MPDCLMASANPLRPTSTVPRYKAYEVVHVTNPHKKGQLLFHNDELHQGHRHLSAFHHCCNQFSHQQSSVSSSRPRTLETIRRLRIIGKRVPTELEWIFLRTILWGWQLQTAFLLPRQEVLWWRLIGQHRSIFAKHNAPQNGSMTIPYRRPGDAIINNSNGTWYWCTFFNMIVEGNFIFNSGGVLGYVF